ncbi:MAG TPA: PSD1 and planctomycete cytochrome C domain-containing protein, partial [Gemmataceae bacterium]|nr:PSD1 and planctomycete cytochrome C domain-containing protein [Gemmataceae bacterium]
MHDRRKDCLIKLSQHAVALVATLLISVVLHAQETKTVSFEKQVRPLLKAHCFECHGDTAKPKGGLDVRLARLLIAGGKTGAAVVPGKAHASLLIERVRSQEMPPGKRKLTKDEIALLERWIAQGSKTDLAEPKALAAGFHITEEERAFWSFQPIRNPEPPRVKGQDRVRTPIDAFLLAKLEAKGLTFSPEAGKRTLIRRLSFDLTGLPPTPKEVDDFLKDESADAYERLVDRLLASPQYGERWGRHWLDIAGYADSEGGSASDTPRASAYRYRDYVIRSFNADKPFDQFVIEQLAGDELLRPPYDKIAPADLDKLIATGFLRMGPDGTGAGDVDAKLARNQMIADTLQIVSTSLMGLTMHCAQCHNHRYDPIPQVDYYGMRAIFEPALDWKNWRTPAGREVVVLSDAERKQAADIEKEAAVIDQVRLKKDKEYIERTFNMELAKLPAELQESARQARNTPPAKRSAAQKKLLGDHPSLNVSSGSLYLYDSKAAADLKTYADKAAKLRATKPIGISVRALTEVPGQVPTTFLFARGDHEQPKDAVAPAHLTILNLGKIPERNPATPTTGRRLAFARSLVDGKHPLTARVLANRIWLNHFGKGIVNTPADFGYLGERPSHPELLDWLASDLMAGGWKLKRLHKLLVTSTAYRQSSRRDAVLDKIDPDNRLLGRMSVRRLDAESVRDAVLAVSGKLNLKQFGPPVPIAYDELGQVVVGIDTTDAAGRPTGKKVSLNGEEYRRSLYVQVRRSRPLAMLEAFDGAAMSPNCEIRHASTVTPQALMLMNSRFVHEYAEDFARRIRKEAGADVRAQIALAWRLCFAEEASQK